MTSIMRSIFLILFIFSPLFAFAQATDTFNVNFQVIGDTAAPSTPSSLSATPVTSSQIDLQWIASTDDVAIGGYQVFRDAVQIATTTLTSYTDTGLTSNTTYSYFVKAFDTSYNYSSSSNSAATTTPASVTVPSQGGSGEGSSAPFALVDLQIDPQSHAVKISWETNRYAQFELHWGRTASYELGFVGNHAYKREQSTTITDLEPGTTYEYQLLAYNKSGTRFVLSEGRFTTLALPDTTPPDNVRDLRAAKEGDDVVLTWENPADADFSHVRIIRSYLFYPTDTSDGFIAYEGSGERHIDVNALRAQPYQYYTVFTYDENGNVSSGAIVAVARDQLPLEEDSNEKIDLAFADVEVLQQGVRVSNEELEAMLPTTVGISYEKLPEHLKTIIVSLSHPEDPATSFSFLLRINRDKTYYEAVIPALLASGEYSATVTVFDHKTQKLAQLKGSLTFKEDEHLRVPVVPLSLTKQSAEKYLLFLFLVILLFLIMLLYLLFHHKRGRALAGLATAALGMIAVGLLFAGARFYLEGEQKEMLRASAVTASIQWDTALVASFLLVLIGTGIGILLVRKKNGDEDKNAI
jgi:chitodextrinase